MRTMLVLSVALAACGGPSTPAPPAQPAEPPLDLLTRSRDSQRAIVHHGEVPYLFHDLVMYFGEDERRGEPECWVMRGNEEGCPATVPAPADIVAEFADRPKQLTVVGTEGLCTATVGDLLLVRTSGCDTSWIVASPLTGCPGDIAPVGRIDATFDPDLRWHPRVDMVGVPLFDAPPPTDPVHRDLVATWLADPELTAGAPHEGKTGRMSIDVGDESLETFAAAFAVGDGDDMCEWNYGERTAVGIRRGDTLTPLDIPAEWDGALSWHGRVVGVVISDPHAVDLRALRPTGPGRAFEQKVWRDHEECTQASWFGIAFPCGP